VQGGEFDGNARAFHEAAPGGLPANGGDRIGIGTKIAIGVISRHRRLAEHVIGKPIAACLTRTCVFERIGDGLAGHELPPEQPHREVGGAAHQRRSATAQQPGQRRA